MADSSIPETKWKRGGGRLSKMSKLPEKKKRNSGAYSRPVRDPSKGDGEGDPERHQWVWTRLSVVKVEKLLVDHAVICHFHDDAHYNCLFWFHELYH
eukprot:m.126938 g.126938  ORF g.126938 m.126938 type:complete len:97 (-) comp14532_c0_seq2:97-387(-)